MTTLKDYKEKVLKSFEERFAMNSNWGIEHSAGDYGLDSPGWNEMQLWLSLAIDNAVAEAFKAVEVEKKEITVIQVSSDGSKSEYMEPDVSFNDALQEIEDRKKQYLV